MSFITIDNKGWRRCVCMCALQSLWHAASVRKMAINIKIDCNCCAINNVWSLREESKRKWRLGYGIYILTHTHTHLYYVSKWPFVQLVSAVCCSLWQFSTGNSPKRINCLSESCLKNIKWPLSTLWRLRGSAFRCCCCNCVPCIVWWATYGDHNISAIKARIKRPSKLWQSSKWSYANRRALAAWVIKK